MDSSLLGSLNITIQIVKNYFQKLHQIYDDAYHIHITFRYVLRKHFSFCTDPSFNTKFDEKKSISSVHIKNNEDINNFIMHRKT